MPEIERKCTNEGYEAGLECAYDYVNLSCEEGEEICSPIETYTCSEDYGWVVAMMDVQECPDPTPTQFMKECDPNNPPVVLSCPESQPEPWGKCTSEGYKAGQDCEYNYQNLSCEEGKEICSPIETYTCTGNDGWILAMMNVYCPDPTPTHFLQKCDPTDPPVVLSCPESQPENQSNCTEQGYEHDLRCGYTYINLSCEEGEENCTPVETFTCSKDYGWENMILSVGQICQDSTYPTHWMKECDPNQVDPPPVLSCPESMPMSNYEGSCVKEGYEPGLECAHNYRNLNCYEKEGDENCVPTETHYCTEENGWIGGMMDMLECDNPPANFWEPCDPL